MLLVPPVSYFHFRKLANLESNQGMIKEPIGF